MKRAEIRLELLKLRHRHDRLPAQIIPEVKELEEYVLEGEPEISEVDSPVKRGPGRPRKDENPNTLS